MTTKGVFIFFVLFTLLSNQQLKAQTTRTVSGSVKDTTDTTIPNVHVRLVSNKDTLSMSTDGEGRFSFKGIKNLGFELLIRGIGYKSFAAKYEFKEDQKDLKLDPITIYQESTTLKEVEIKGKLTPVRVMKDTIEYNAAAFVIREDDYVEDLLKQLPGMEVDADGNTKSMGKELTKIRVNGKDFFTGNVKEFIKQLPAEMFSHVQVIDDYGDGANFTGIKIGPPAKILNLVTKPGRDKGTFGNVSVIAGTNARYGTNGSANLWKGTRQYGFNGNLNNSNNSAGINNSISLDGNLRQQLNKDLSFSGSYNYSGNRSKRQQSSYIESFNELGTIFTNSDTEFEHTGNSGNFNLAVNGLILDGLTLKDYFDASLNGSLSTSRSNNLSASLQSGDVIHQDLITRNKGENNSPRLDANVSWGKKIGKKRNRVVLMNFSGYLTETSGTGDILTQIGYYDRLTDLPVKDSVLNRIIDNGNTGNGFTGSFTFTEPLTKATDTVKSKSLNISYMVSISNTSNSLQTRVRNVAGQISFVDSLSNVYTSRFINQNLSIGFSHESREIGYNFGLSIQPNSLKGSYEGRTEKTNQNTVNIAPRADIRLVISRTSSVTMNYNGSTAAPRFDQLQPVPDTRNLQHVIIGNPDLKTSFNHAANISYNVFGATTGRALMIGFSGSATQNQIVNNVIFVRDTLNGLKQETRFENANGNYNISTNYSLSTPVFKNKVVLSLNGNLNHYNTVLFSDNVKNYSSGLGFNQSVNASLNFKKLAGSLGASYSVRENNYSLPNSSNRNIEIVGINLNTRIIFSKAFFATLNASKQFNMGYSLNQTNPLLIGAGISTSFLKNRLANIAVQANDLLNQGNVFNRFASSNAIVETRTNQVTRYVTMTLSLKLQRFGGNKM